MKKIHIIIIIILLLIVSIGGKRYMDEQENIKQERNAAVKAIQEEVSEYIITNYSGVEKIEWNGWSTGAGPFTINTSMTINDYTDEWDGKVQFSYSAGYSEYIKKYTDGVLINKDSEYLGETEFQKMGIKSSKNGSPNAKIIYNYEEHK